MKYASHIADAMADSLIDHGIDVGDESEVIVHLKSAGYMARDITAHMDAAIERVRVRLAHSNELKVA